MLINAKPKINFKNQYFFPGLSGPACCQLQHPKTLIGLSRQRLTTGDVLNLIDNRRIRWAWDISRHGAHRPEIRIWRESLAAYLAAENGAAPPPAEDVTLGQVIEAILPHPPVALSPPATTPRGRKLQQALLPDSDRTAGTRATTLRARELQRRWLCSQMLIRRLISDGELCSVGPLSSGTSPAILYQSAFEFLKRRSLSV